MCASVSCRRLRLALLASAAALAAAGQAPIAAAAEPPPPAVALAEGWEYRTDAGDRGLGAGWGTQPPQQGWSGVQLPHVFSADPREEAFGGTVGWYRLRFTAPAEVAGYDRALRFEQVRREARIFLNGSEIGRHADPYVPFVVPAAGLRAGAVNELVVRVDNRKAKEPREGWWNWGGIVRPVTLVPRGRLVLRDPGLMSQVVCPDGAASCRASLLVDGTLENLGATPVRRPEVRVGLSGPGEVSGRTVARTLLPGESTRVRFTVPVPDARLWAPGSPVLYDARLRTVADDEVTQEDRRRVGLREVAVRDGILQLNGEAVDLRGASIQEDLRGRGPALRPEDIATIVSELKALGATVTRAHYLLNPKLLDALDEAGIMVWSQAPIYHRDRLLETVAQRDVALRTLRDTVLEARSHASVITHSVANELSAVPDKVPGTRRFLADARAAVLDLDPTLPTSIDLLSYPGYPAARAHAAFDLLGINSYFGWYPGKKRHSTANIADLGPHLDRMRRMYPRAAMVVTEFGAESTFDGPEATKETYAYQARYVGRVLEAIRERPHIGGVIYWTLREFAVKPDWDGGAKRSVPRDGIHNKGLITYDGRRKPAWAVARADFARTSLMRDVSPAGAAGLPDRGGSGLPLAILAVLGVGLVLVLDFWALGGILRGRRLQPGSQPE